MSAPRHDLYSVIHKALRSMLFRQATALATVDPLDEQAVAEIAAFQHTLNGFIDDHAGHEEAHVHPLIRKAAPDRAAHLDEHHDTLRARGDAIAASLDALADVHGPARIPTVAAIRRDFEAFMVAHLEHFAEEEGECNPLLWEAYDDGVLREAQGRIQGSIAPERFGEWLQWMIPAMNVNERAGMLIGMSAAAPPPVVEGFKAVVRAHLGDEGVQATEARAKLLLAA